MRHYVESCFLCQTNNVEQVKHLGLLQPLAISISKWESISMDFIVNFLRSQKGFDSILVVIDRLTTMAHFIPIVTTGTTLGVVELFVKEVCVNNEL